MGQILSFLFGGGDPRRDFFPSYFTRFPSLFLSLNPPPVKTYGVQLALPRHDKVILIDPLFRGAWSRMIW